MPLINKSFVAAYKEQLGKIVRHREILGAIVKHCIHTSMRRFKIFLARKPPNSQPRFLILFREHRSPTPIGPAIMASLLVTR